MNNYIIGQSTLDTLIPKSPEQLKDMVGSPQGLTLIGCLVAFGLLSFLDGDKKPLLASGRWAKAAEKNAAKKKALQQINSPSRNTVSFYLGQPAFIRYQLELEFYNRLKNTALATQTTKPKKRRATNSLYLPDAQRGIAAIGAAGSGKIFSVIDPVIRSSLDQGFPTLIDDFKYPAQTSRAVAYAIKRGYQVRVFAPGFPESDTCNPFDFLKDSEDAIAAGQLAQVINRNIDRGSKGGDKFFEEAGDVLVEGIFLAIKALGELRGDNSLCDLMSASALLSMPNLPHRLEEAINRGDLGVWTSRPLQQLISTKDSEKTVAGILATAQRVFQRFLKKDFIGAFCGETTLPLDVDGKTLIIFGLDRTNRDIVSPLLAAIFHMIVARNVSRPTPRREPLVVSIDELPTLYLPQLVNWLNENREDGFCGILGFQNISQLEKVYGKELTRAIIGGCGTKVVFNPQDTESAKYFSDLLGEEEVNFKSKSDSKNVGGKSNKSKSYSEQRQKKHLFEPAEFAKLPTGKGIIINPAYGNKQESYLPLLTKIKVPKTDLSEQEWSESNWQKCRQKMLVDSESRNPLLFADNYIRTEQFQERKAIVEEVFYLAKDKNNNASQNPNNSTINFQKNEEFSENIKYNNDNNLTPLEETC